jgi:hypothetical protein
MQWRVPQVAQQVYQLAGLTASVPNPITGGQKVLRADHVAWEWPMKVTNWQLVLVQTAWFFAS